MTLTTQDLNAIGQIVDKRLEVQLSKELKKELKPIKRDLKSIRKDLDWVIGKYDTRLSSLEQHITHPPKSIDFSLAI